MLLRPLPSLHPGAPAAPADTELADRPRRRGHRWLFGVGLSLAAHVVVVSVLVANARKVQIPAGEGGDLGVDMVRVDPLDEPSASPAPRALDSALPARNAEAVARPSRRTGTPGRPQRLASITPSAPAPTPAIPPPLEQPVPLTPPPAPAGQAADQAARAAFRATLRKHLYQAWRAGDVYQRIDPQGKMAGSLFTTSVQVRLRPDGGIQRAELLQSSGVPALDKEALGALERLQPLPRLPQEMLDAQGGWPVLCKFYLDVGMFRFAAQIRQALSEKWQPSRAFALTAESERRTVLRFLLTAQGALVSAEVVSGSGMQLLDDNALAVAQPGLRLPPPPPALIPKDGPAQVFVAFLHQAGDVRVMKPREDVEEE